MSRDKGAEGEREVVRIAASLGIEAERTAQMQAGSPRRAYGDVSLVYHPVYHVEVKRDERLSVDAMVRQVLTAHDPAWHVPVVIWRRNQTGLNKGVGWWAAQPLRSFLVPLMPDEGEGL